MARLMGVLVGGDGGGEERMWRKGLTMSYQPGMRMPMFTVMGIMGALGKMNATSSNLPRRRHVSARKVLGWCERVIGGEGGKRSLPASTAAVKWLVGAEQTRDGRRTYHRVRARISRSQSSSSLRVRRLLRRWIALCDEPIARVYEMRFRTRARLVEDGSIK